MPVELRPGTPVLAHSLSTSSTSASAPSKSKSNKIEKEASLADVSLDAARQHLQSAQRAAARQRWRVSGSAFALAAVCLLIFILGFPLTTIVSDGIFYFFIFMPPGVVLCCLAILPKDEIAIRVVSALGTLITTIAALGLLSTLPTQILQLTGDVPAVDCAPTSYCLVITIGGGVAGVLFIVCALLLGWTLRPNGCCPCCRTGFRMPARDALQRMWSSLRLVLGALALNMLAAQVAAAVGVDGYTATANFSSGLCFAAALALCCALPTPSLRGRAQRALVRMYGRGEELQAASVAALINDLGVTRALNRAKQNFRGLPLAELTEDDLRSSADTGLFEKSAHAALGELDAFVSHAWRDPAPPKYAALVAWGRSFEEANGRAPMVWLDKACVNQSRIQEALACLPVWLAGCESLLVLASSSYASRLWCVIELHTWCVMGGDLARVSVLPVAPAAELHASFARFRVENADCFVADDKARLLAVIESGFGTHDAFSALIRDLMRSRLPGKGSEAKV